MQPDFTLCIAAFGLSGWHMLIVLFVALLMFGRRLPELLRGLGSSVREFKKGMAEDPSTVAPPPAAQAPIPRAPTI